MHLIDRFTLRDMTECSAALRQFGSVSATAADVAKLTVKYLYDNLADAETAAPSCALVRFFKTESYRDLTPAQKEVALSLLPAGADTQALKCLTLLATTGIEDGWNEVERSQAHRAIPLPSPEFVREFPMIARLLGQFGIPIEHLFEADESLIMDLAQTAFNVFHVADALGSPYVPAQDDFVKPYAIRSVLGFGGVLPTGELYSVIIFSRSRIPRDTAEMFKTLALSVKLALLAVNHRH